MERVKKREWGPKTVKTQDAEDIRMFSGGVKIGRKCKVEKR